MRRHASRDKARDEEKLRQFIASGPHLASVLIFPGASAYDVGAVAEVFSTANGQVRRERGINRDVYDVEVVSSTAGPVTLEMGLKMMPDITIREQSRKIDTLLLSGGCWDPMDAALADREMIGWIKRTAGKVRRVASLCTGAFLLAEAGLAKNAVTTHWAQCDRLRARYPHLTVSADNIYLKDGNIYSSAGSTSAMDLALALVEEDLGRKLAMNVARRLVMFLKRPGGQSQFSTALLAQTASTDSLRDLPEWIIDNLEKDLSVEAMAERVGMSPRNFARVFAAETGLTPAKYVERARLERARQLIEETALPLLTVASGAGFESDQHLRRTFVRWLGVTPADYMARFRHPPREISVRSFPKGALPIPREAMQPWLP